MSSSVIAGLSCLRIGSPRLFYCLADEGLDIWRRHPGDRSLAAVAPEYNYGPSAVLKNAIDWVYPEWNRKAAGFVSYGSAMGARSVQQLRETAIELQLAPIRSSVHIPVATLWAHYQGGDVDAGLAELEAPAGTLIDDLLWWTAALKTARASAS
ncbi:MAG TPA: NAD(P)H-dependent oxidoreductase [Candidatus Dormibacteraeota bacterium]